MDLQIERIDLGQVRRNVRKRLHRDFGGALRSGGRGGRTTSELDYSVGAELGYTCKFGVSKSTGCLPSNWV